MADLTLERAREMVRLRVLEANPTFWQQDQCDRAIDDGARRFLDLVVGGTHLARRLRRHGHPLLRRYIALQSGSLGVGQYEDSIPADLWYEIEFRILSSPPLEAKWKEPADDRYIRMYPKEFGPVSDEAFWSIVPSDDATAVIRVYISDDGWLSNRQLTYKFFYFRRYSPCWNQSPPATTVDMDEELAEGMVSYAAGKMLADQRTNPQPLYDEAAEFARRVGLPPLDAQMTTVLPKKVP